jgi:hypothetical protein
MIARSRTWLLIPVAALAYPLVVATGGAPHFPTRGECLPKPKAGHQLEAVFGRFTRQPPAEALLARVRQLGFANSFVEVDNCGMMTVAVRGIPSIAVGQGLVAEARRVGLRPTLATAPP